MRTPRALALLVFLAPVAVTVPAADAAVRRPAVDFNGDGFGDLAIGAPGESMGSARRAGAVTVLYGSATGLSRSAAQLWHQDSTGVPDAAEDDDGFGTTLAAADFNGDGYSDLAAAAPYEDISGGAGAGSVHILFGSASGLRASGAQRWTRTNAAAPAAPDRTAGFGVALAVGDLDGDGRRDDLAVGSPAGSAQDAAVRHGGRVFALYGGAGGLRPGRSFGDPHADPIAGFGSALVAARFDGNGPHDLAVGAPADSVVDSDGTARTVEFAGRVWLLRGSANGLTETGRRSYDADTPGVVGAAEPGQNFGDQLAAGDFDGDGRAELVVGVPKAKVGTSHYAGVVHVLPGTTSGPSGSGSKRWHQDTPGVPGVPEPAMNSYSAVESDYFGAALATGDVDGDGRADLAIGTPRDDITALRDGAGSVTVLRGSASGLTTAGVRLWHQDVSGVPGVAEYGDGFGGALTANDVNRDGRADLAIGVGSESIGNLFAAGAAQVLLGGAAGLRTSGAQQWHQDVAGVPGASERYDYFGNGLG
ncbi:MAG TPA: hypothetical protein VNA20_00630 [Frankiaceae bacterium]|nr:hypothetical protein [Frankiaceae bacterium]